MGQDMPQCYSLFFADSPFGEPCRKRRIGIGDLAVFNELADSQRYNALGHRIDAERLFRDIAEIAFRYYVAILS